MNISDAKKVMLDKVNLEIELPSDSLDRVKVVEKWFRELDNRWYVMRKQQKETMKKVEEEVLAYLDN